MIEKINSGEGSTTINTIKMFCDKCPEIATESHMFEHICNRELQKIGWRLYKNKHLCPNCVLELTMKKEFRDIYEERMKFIAQNKEKLIEAWFAETGLLPSESVLCSNEEFTKFWVQKRTDETTK